MPQKKMTLEYLAAMVKEGFDEQRDYMDSQFTEVREQISELQKDMSRVNLKQSDHDTLLHRIDRRTHSQQEQLEAHELRLQRVEK